MLLVNSSLSKSSKLERTIPCNTIRRYVSREISHLYFLSCGQWCSASRLWLWLFVLLYYHHQIRSTNPMPLFGYQPWVNYLCLVSLYNFIDNYILISLSLHSIQAGKLNNIHRNWTKQQTLCPCPTQTMIHLWRHMDLRRTTRTLLSTGQSITMPSRPRYATAYCL